MGLRRWVRGSRNLKETRRFLLEGLKVREEQILNPSRRRRNFPSKGRTPIIPHEEGIYESDEMWKNCCL